MLNAKTTNTKLAASLTANNSDEKQNNQSKQLRRLLPEVQRLAGIQTHRQRKRRKIQMPLVRHRNAREGSGLTLRMSHAGLKP